MSEELLPSVYKEIDIIFRRLGASDGRLSEEIIVELLKEYKEQFP